MDISDYGPLLTAEAFLEIDFGERIKAELDDGVVIPLVRGPRKRVRVATNLLVLIAGPLRGTGLGAYGSLLMVKTGARSVRFPDVAVYAEGEPIAASEGDRDLMQNPIVAVHVRTMNSSEIGRLLGEYQAINAVQAMMFVDHETEIVRVIQRTASGAWLDERIESGGEAALQALNLVIPHAEIFSRD